MCMPCPLSNLRLCSLDRSHHKSSHPSRALGPLKPESSAVLSDLEPVLGYNVSQVLVHGGTGILEHATAPSTVVIPRPALLKQRMPLVAQLQFWAAAKLMPATWRGSLVHRQLFPGTSLLITRRHSLWGSLFNTGDACIAFLF